MQTLRLPIELEELPPETRSWMITKSSALGIDPARMVRDLLIRMAARDGFKAKPEKKITP